MLSAIVLTSHVSAFAQSQCDISINLGSDTLTYQDTYICLPLTAKNFQNVSELELSITLPDLDIAFRDAQMIHPSLSQMKISASNFEGKSIVQLVWTTDEGSSVSIGDGVTFGELCFDIIDYPHEGFDMKFEGLGLQQGNSIVQDNQSKLFCVNPGRIESPCSARKFRIHEEATFRNTDRCRNDCTGISYPNHKHPESDLPITVQVYNDGNLVWDRIIMTNDRMEGWMDTCFYWGLIEVFVWNKDGCMDSTSFNSLPMLDSTVNYDGGLGWGAPEIQHTCQGVSDGSILVRPGTTIGDTLYWDNGDVQPVYTLGAFSRENLEPGIYSGYQELKDCRATAYFEVLNIPTYDVNHNTRFATCDGSDGSIWIETNPSGNYKYNWEGRSDTTAIIENLIPGTYEVTVTNPEGCQVERSIVLPMTGYIHLEWESEVTYPDCLPGTKASRTISLNSNNIAGADFIWSSGEGSSGTSATATQLESGVQWVYAHTSTCASDTMFFEVPIASKFDITIDSSMSSFEVCPGNTARIQLSYSESDPPTVYNESGDEIGWQFDLVPGTHTLRVVSGNGCEESWAITIVEIVFERGSHFDFVNLDTMILCPEEVALIEFIALDSSVHELYLNGNIFFEGDEIPFVVDDNVISITSSLGCMWDTLIIVEERMLDISVPGDFTIEEGREIGIVTIHDEIEPLIYTWTATNPWSCAWEDCRVIDYNPLESETIYLNVRNDLGCTYEDSMVVTVIDTMEVDTVVVVIPPSGEDFYIPNIISQSSAINNEFCVALTDVIQTVDFFALYDRWGNQVALASDPNSARSVCLTESLSLQSQQLSSGVYVYVIQFTYVDGQTVSRSGNVTML